ncbi:MAG: hypothetical protein Fur0010_20450 [Bdellovibrio sp.]
MSKETFNDRFTLGVYMFGLFKKNEKKKLKEDYQKIMARAVEAQRNGNIDLYSQLIHESEEIAKKIDQIKSQEN